MAKSEAVRLMEENGAVGKLRSWPARVKGFYTDVRTEMKKVSTPSRKEVQATTIVVVITVFLFGVYFFLIDSVLGRAIEKLFSYFQ